MAPKGYPPHFPVIGDNLAVKFTTQQSVGLFTIAPVPSGGSWWWVLSLDDEEIGKFGEADQAFDHLLDGKKPWPSCGDPRKLYLPEPNEWTWSPAKF